MVIEVHHMESPLSGRFIKPRGEWGRVQVLVVDYFVGHLSHNSSKDVRSAVSPTTNE
jgi:hypothetical protein